MRNFNNGPNGSILPGYLPDVLKDVARAATLIMDAGNAGNSGDLWQACEDCMNDQFISEADVRTASTRQGKDARASRRLATDTLDDRRFRLLVPLHARTSRTRGKACSVLLASLCGEGGLSACSFQRAALCSRGQRSR